MLTKTQYQNNLKLIKNLRTKKYKQGQQALRTAENKFCCIGVACDLINPKRWSPDASIVKEAYSYAGEENYGLPTHYIWATAYGWPAVSGPASEDGSNLIDMNDDLGSSFSEIADHLENWVGKQEIQGFNG